MQEEDLRYRKDDNRKLVVEETRRFIEENREIILRRVKERIKAEKQQNAQKKL